MGAEFLGFQILFVDFFTTGPFCAPSWLPSVSWRLSQSLLRTATPYIRATIRTGGLILEYSNLTKRAWFRTGSHQLRISRFWDSIWAMTFSVRLRLNLERPRSLREVMQQRVDPKSAMYPRKGESISYLRRARSANCFTFSGGARLEGQRALC